MLDVAERMAMAAEMYGDRLDVCSHDEEGRIEVPDVPVTCPWCGAWLRQTRNEFGAFALACPARGCAGIVYEEWE